MSMAAILETVRDHLRDTLELSNAQCDIRPGGTPPRAAGEYYIALDDAGIASTAREHLAEEFHVEISLWRRASQLPDDRLGELALREDPYLAGLATLDALERAVIAAVHANYAEIMTAANTTLGAGEPGGGDVFQLALYYAGRARAEIHPPRTHAERPLEWVARRLTFRGMTRVQATDVMQ